jgi:tetratricopeptide (TPR) repeat protein
MGRQLTLAAALVVGLAAPLRADLTVEALVGNAITGVGPYYQDVYDAIRSFGNHDYKSALAQLAHAKKTVPRLPPPEVMMALLYFDAKDAPGGIGMLEKAVGTAPEDPEAYVILAERAVSDGRFVEADILLDKGTKLIAAFGENPKRKQNLQQRSLAAWANLEEGRGNLKEARAKLEAWLQLDPRNAAGQERLGRVLFALQDLKAAYGAFRLAADNDKDKPSAEIAMALLFEDPVNAEKWVKAALSKSPQDLRTQIGASRLFLKANQLDESKAHAQEAVKLAPDNMEANMVLGMAARLTGDFKLAETHLSKAHLLAPNNAVVTNTLALTLLELPDDEQHQRAMQFAEQNARLNPNSIEIVATLGWVSFRLNRRIEAERAFGFVFNSARGGTMNINADIAYYLANFSKERGNTTEAMKLLKDSLASNSPFAYRKQAQALYAQLAKFEKARLGKTETAKTTEKVKEEAAQSSKEDVTK